LENRERKRKIINVFKEIFGTSVKISEHNLLMMTEEQLFIKLRRKQIK
jgi:hypothetical protein